MESKLNLNPELIDSARSAAGRIAEDVQEFIDKNTTVTVERTVARLMGVDGVDEIEKPLPNVLVDNIKEGGGLSRGAAFWIGNAMVNTGKSPQEIAEKISAGEIDITKLPIADENKIMEAVYETAKQMVEKIKNNRAKRDNYLNTIGEGNKPYLYVIVATGNIYEDIIQAQAAAKQGADVIAVIRTTAQSLLDYVPYGPTTEGFGGT
ncbi:MAG: lysine 5,6-aminomutase subunit alpha, partial [Sedimentibacter sp.]